MDASTEQAESCQGARPYSPSDIMTYDISSDESDTKDTRIEFGPVVKTSSSSSDSSDDSFSSYEYHWEEAKPAKPPFESFITSINIGCTELPAVKREYTTVVPLKVIFERLLLNGSSNAFKIVSKLGVHQLTKHEADLLTDHVNSLKTSVLDDCDTYSDAGSTQFNRGDAACSYTSLKQEYVGLLQDLATGQNSNFGKKNRSFDGIGRRNDAAAYRAAHINAQLNLAFVSHLGSSDDDCEKSKENLSSRISSLSSSKMCSVNENSRKKTAYHAVEDRHAKVTEELDNEICLNRALSQIENCENKTGESPKLKDRAESCYTRNAVVLPHLDPENEGEDFDAEISRVLSIVRRKQNGKKMRSERTKDLPSRIVEKPDMKDREHSTSNPSYTKPSQDWEKDGENDEILELIHEKSANELITTTRTNWKALECTSDNSRVGKDVRPSIHGEKIASTSASTICSPAIRIFWNTPKIATKTIGVSVFSDNDTSTTNDEAADVPAPIIDERSFNAGSNIPSSHSPPATSCSANQPEQVSTIKQTGSEFNDSVKLVSEWAVTDSYICKSPDQYLTPFSRTVRAIRGEYTTSNCDHYHNNLIHRLNSAERMDSSSITDENECDNSDSKHEKKNRRDMCQCPDNVEILSSPSNSSSIGTRKGTFSPTKSKKVERKPLSSSVFKMNIKDHRRSVRSQIHRNSRQRRDSTNRDGDASNHRKTARSKITKSSLRERTTRERSRSSTSEKDLVNEKSSPNDNSGVVFSGVDAPKSESTMFTEEKRVSEGNQALSTNYSKLRYTYDSTIYSPISSDDAEFGISDSCDEATSRTTKTRKVLRRRSVRDSSRTPDERSGERRKSIRDEMPKLQSYQCDVSYPITRVDDGKEDNSSMTVTPNLLPYNPSNSRLKANVENLVVSIRSQCDRDVSVIENRSKLPSRHVVTRRSPDRRRSSKQRIRRRSHSPSCRRSVSPVSYRRRGSKRRRSLSPVRTRHSREKGNGEIDGAGIGAKLFRRHKRDSTHSRVFNFTDNERSTDEVGNRLTGTHDPEMRYSSLQSSEINCSQRNALSNVDGESVFHDKYHEHYSAERSASNGIKSVSNKSRRDKAVRRREVRGRLDSSGLERMSYDMLSLNGSNLDDDEVVIFKKMNPLDECWPFFFHKSDEGMSSEDENYDDEGCFMIGKLIVSLRNSKIASEMKKLQRTKKDNISNEQLCHANTPSVESTPINLRQPADLSKTADQKSSCDAVEYQLDVINVPMQSHDREGNRQELRNDDTRNAETETSSILHDIPNELPSTRSECIPANSDGVSEKERCHAESCTILNTEATYRGSVNVSVSVIATSPVQCEEKGIAEDLAVALPLQSDRIANDTAMTSCESPAAENCHAVARRQISPDVEVNAAVSSPCAYEEVAITGDNTVDKLNARLVGTSALHAGLNLIPSDSLNVIVSADEKSSKLSSIPQHVTDDTSDSPNICYVDQEGMCLGATVTVEDDKLSRTTPQNISNEPSGAKSWKKKLIEKAQNTHTSSKENEETSLNLNRNDAILSQDSSSESRCLPAANYSRYDGSVNIENISETPTPLPDKSLSPDLTSDESSVLKEKSPLSTARSNEGDMAADNQEEVSTRSDLLEVNNSHSIDSDGAKNLLEESAESNHPVGDTSTTEGNAAIKSGNKVLAAESADIASECNSVNIAALVDDSVSVNADSSLDSTAEQISQGNDEMSIVCHTDGTESKVIPEPETMTIFPSEDAVVLTRPPTSERLENEQARSVVESAINQNKSEENPAKVSLLNKNAVVSSNIPSSASEAIYPANDEITLISTRVENQLESEIGISSLKDTIENSSSISSNSVEEPKENNTTLPASAKLTDDSISTDFVLKDCSRTPQDKTPPTPRCVPNTFKSIEGDSQTVSLLSNPSHSTKFSLPVQIPPKCNETPSSSADVAGKLEMQNTNGSVNSSEIFSNRINSLNDLCDSIAVAQTTVPYKNSSTMSMADMGHDGEKLAGLDNSSSSSVSTTKVTGKDTVPRINFSISGASGSLQSSSSTKNASCLSSSRIFAGPASSITIVNRPPVPVGLSNKSAFRGPSVELKLNQPKTILSKPWESFTKLQTANVSLSPNIENASSMQHRNMREHHWNIQPEKTSKPLKSILLNRNENPAFLNNNESAIVSHKNPGEVISISKSKADNEVTYAENHETNDMIPDADLNNIRKYAPECSKKRKADIKSVNEISSKTRKSKNKRIYVKKSPSLPSCTNKKVLSLPAEVEIGGGEFAEGDEVIGSLLPLIKTKAKRKAKKMRSSGRGRGRAKQRGRLPSISSDEDIIEELSAAKQQPSSENKSNTQTENDILKTEDDEDSDDGLVSFMGIIRSSDTILPIVPDIKQEAESDHGEDEANVFTDSDGNNSETTENQTVEDRPGKSGNAPEPDNNDVENIFAKLSREMEEMNGSQSLFEDSLASSTFQDRNTTSNQSNIDNKISNLPGVSKYANDEGINDGEAVNSERISDEPFHRNNEASESLYHNCNNGNSRATPLTIPDNISPNILTPPSSPKSDDNSKRVAAHCSDPKTSKAQQNKKPVEDFPTHSAKEAVSPNTTQHIVTNLSSAFTSDAKDNVPPSLNQKTSKTAIAAKPLTNTVMPAGKSCHGFLEICLYGFDNPDKFTYALRRIPYVRATAHVGESQNISGQENGSELSSEASSTFATYLRVRDVICLLKIDVGRLHSLITRSRVQLFRPSDYTKDLFATVYDPVGKSDPILAKMTWRHVLEGHVQKFLDHMIILDKFLHSILPRFYVETLNIRTSDVPNFVNVKIFKPIFQINEEVVKIFRKPYEYNSVLIKKDYSIQRACVNKRDISNATPSAERTCRSTAARSKEIGPRLQQQNGRRTTWNENATRNGLTAPHTATPITVPTPSTRFVGNGQSTTTAFPSLGYLAFADPRHFQNRSGPETRSLRSRVHHCDDRTGMVPTTDVGFHTRVKETAYHADMIQLSRMGTMVSNESPEYIRRSTPMLPLPTGLGVQNTIPRFEMPFMSVHEKHEQAVVNVNAHPYMRLYGNTFGGVDYTHSGSQQLFSGNTGASKLCSANNAPEIQRQNAAALVAQQKSGPTQSGIDVLAEAAAAVCATDAGKAMPERKAKRNTRSGNQARRSPKVTTNARSTVDRDDDSTQKPKKRKYQSTRTTRKSARETKSKS